MRIQLYRLSRSSDKKTVEFGLNIQGPSHRPCVNLFTLSQSGDLLLCDELPQICKYLFATRSELQTCSRVSDINWIFCAGDAACHVKFGETDDGQLFHMYFDQEVIGIEQRHRGWENFSERKGGFLQLKNISEYEDFYREISPLMIANSAKNIGNSYVVPCHDTKHFGRHLHTDVVDDGFVGTPFVTTSFFLADARKVLEALRFPNRVGDADLYRTFNDAVFIESVSEINSLAQRTDLGYWTFNDAHDTSLVLSGSKTLCKVAELGFSSLVNGFGLKIYSDQACNHQR